MTAFYLLVSDEDELRDLSHGHTSPMIRDMARTMLEWHQQDDANVATPAPVSTVVKTKTAKQKRAHRL